MFETFACGGHNISRRLRAILEVDLDKHVLTYSIKKEMAACAGIVTAQTKCKR
jgi:hypothetical protein